MSAEPVIAIFDVGKTNKKLFLFNQDYEVVFERSAKFNEITDEDGYPCENLDALDLSLKESLTELRGMTNFDVKAINFSTYGASFVFIDNTGRAVTPLYNYLKPYPDKLKDEFYANYDYNNSFVRQTASPRLGSLNSGLQIYRLKKERPQLFARVKYALHLPQYLSYKVTGETYSDITSVGCHTSLWDFEAAKYHKWVEQEGINKILAPIFDSTRTIKQLWNKREIAVGTGLHDSSAALIPYLQNFSESFILMSTGTWSISLNPFNHDPLTIAELQQDCLQYLDFNGNPVKASRLFSGREHEIAIKRISEFFSQNTSLFKNLKFNNDLYQAYNISQPVIALSTESFEEVDLAGFKNAEEAYYYLINWIMVRQVVSTKIVLGTASIKRVFVDGGFSKNNIFMNMLAQAFPEMEVYAASMSQGTALGAALAIHQSWNPKPMPTNLIKLNYYSGTPLLK